MTNKNVPVVILALANDVAPFSTLDPASILVTQLTTSNGLATANVNGTITYAPAAGFSGNDTFTYTVANIAGTRSNAATVTVTFDINRSGQPSNVQIEQSSGFYHSCAIIIRRVSMPGPSTRSIGVVAAYHQRTNSRPQTTQKLRRSHSGPSWKSGRS